MLGSTVATNLFGEDADPTGQIIRIKNQPFKVIGVMASKGSSTGGDDQDDSVVMPYTTAQKKLMGIKHIQNITVSAASAGEWPTRGRAIEDAAPHPPQDHARRLRRLHGPDARGNGRHADGDHARR